jgi:hypothetical protein
MVRSWAQMQKETVAHPKTGCVQFYQQLNKLLNNLHFVLMPVLYSIPTEKSGTNSSLL